jgi:hypothetical protein
VCWLVTQNREFLPLKLLASIPIIDGIPSNVNPKIGKKDEIVWLDLLNKRFSVKVA